MPMILFLRTQDPYSQWHPSRFVDPASGRAFNCAEQFMMAAKADLFGDDAVADAVMEISGAFPDLADADDVKRWNAEVPARQKALGRRVRGFDEALWAERREDIVFRAGFLKFSQNPHMRKRMMRDGAGDPATLFVEAAPYDRIWGIGLSASDPRARDPRQWKGLNLLGASLTRLHRLFLEETAR